VGGVSKNATTPVEGSYYPSSKITLSIRFDEFADPTVANSAPPTPINVLRGTAVATQPLSVQSDPSAPAGSTRLILLPAGQTTPGGGPQGQQGSSDGYTAVVAGIIPRKFSWSQNGIRAGATLSVTLSAYDLPFDPRLVRSCAVEMFFGCVSADDYAAGSAGKTRDASQGGDSAQEPLNIIPETYTDDDGNPRTNSRFQGFVDNKWEVTWDGEDEPTVELECLDNTHLLVNVEAPPKVTLDATKPIDRAVAGYLANFPTFNGMSVEYRPSSQPSSWPGDLTFPPTMKQALAGTAFQPELGPVAAKGAGAAEKLSVWDYLTDACGAIGHSVYVEGTTVVITQVQTLLSNTGQNRTDDPFQGRTVDGQSFTYRRLLWGRNLGKVAIRRNFSKLVPQGVEVRCYSPRRKKTLVVRFPDPVTVGPKSGASQVPVTALPGDGSTDQKWKVVKVAGIEAESVLKQIAMAAYVSLGRMQFEMELTTNNMGSFGGGNLDPDILDMRPGDPFEFLVVNSDQYYAGLLVQESALTQDAAKVYQDLGFSQQVAQAAAKAYVNAGYQTVFRLRSLAVDWDPEDEEEPVKLELHAVNYVEVRADAPVAAS
jgi:hypothetical protein